MCPTLLRIGPVPIHSYGLMIAVGFLFALYLMRRDAKRVGINPDIVSDGAFWSLVLGLIGCRVAHIIMYSENYSWRNPLGWFAIWEGGLVFQGAVIPVFLFSIFYLRARKTNFWKTAEVVCPYIPFAHGFGRIGCFLNGCCYGAVTDLPWGIPFRRIPSDPSITPTGSAPFFDHVQNYGVSPHAAWSLPVHPTQLYEMAGLFAICGILVLLRNKWHPFDGLSLAGYLFLYGILRFIVEFFRADHNPRHLIQQFSDQQVYSLLTALLGVGIFIFLALRKRGRQNAPDSAATYFANLQKHPT